MGMMKERFSEEVCRTIEKAVANGTEQKFFIDFFTQEINNIMDTVNNALEHFYVVKIAIKEVEDTYNSCNNLLEACSEENEYFEDMYEILEDIENIFD